jgi:hypothetical protein
MTGVVGVIAGGVPSRPLAALTIGTSYSSTDTVNAQLFLNFKTNGTWDLTVGGGDILAGSPTSATWLPIGQIASNYEVKFTVTTPPNGNGVVTNGASTFQAITATRSIDILVPGSVADEDFIVVTVDLRKISYPSDAVQDTNITMTSTVT